MIACAPANRPSVELQFFRMLNGLLEPSIRAGIGSPRLAPGGFIVVEARGRKTGRRIRTPLAALRLGNHVLVSTFRGGRSTWVKNLSAGPDVRYWLGGRVRRARATVISADDPKPSVADLPRPLRLLAQVLAPYTHAGWAFAILAPAASRRTPRKAAATARVG